MITVYDFPKELPIKEKEYIEKLTKAFKKKFKLENIDVIFVDEIQIRKLNKEYREVDEVTDVLSFNYNTSSILGEVYICLEYIKKNREDIPILSELYRLTIHGMLHLYGYDHISNFIDRTQPNLENMYEIQESILDDTIID